MINLGMIICSILYIWYYSVLLVSMESLGWLVLDVLDARLGAHSEFRAGW